MAVFALKIFGPVYMVAVLQVYMVAVLHGRSVEISGIFSVFGKIDGKCWKFSLSEKNISG